MTFSAISCVSCRQRGQRNHRNQERKHRNTSHDHHWSETSDIKIDQNQSVNDDDDNGRHAYLMTADAKPGVTELDDDHTLALAFAKHMRPRPTNKHFKNIHDVYAYKLPSDLWFIIRYSKNTTDGQFEKYMNIVDSVTTYLDKLNEDITVSINVKGVETVFRLVKSNKKS